jgi:acetylornithine/succinyldiaminopimelate/putrescine aminotransferase/pimeloyl-ACP methyl ester carboxylesterase/acyl carrier protein
MNNHIQPQYNEKLSAAEALKFLGDEKPAPAEQPNTTRRVSEIKDNDDTLSNLIEVDLRELVLKVLKVEPQDFSSNKPLMDYGLDSIASSDIANLFTSRFDINIPPTLFFEFQDLHSFKNYLLKSYKTKLQAIYKDRLSIELPSTHDSTVQLVSEVKSQTSKNNQPADASLPTTLAEPITSKQSDVPSYDKKNTMLSIEELWEEGNGSITKDISARQISLAEDSMVELPSILPVMNDEPDRELLNSMIPYMDSAQIVSTTREGGARIECAVYGSGQPVLLLGGLLMEYSVMWRLQMKELGKHNRLVMFHIPGCAGSEVYEGMSLESISNDIVQVLDTLGINEPIPIIGYSFGGVLAQEFCLAHPSRCSALNVTVSSPFAEGASDFQVLMRELQKNELFMEMNRGWSIPSLPAYQKVIDNFDFRLSLCDIKVPTLIVAGGEDDYQPLEYSRLIAESIPDARLVEYPNAGHLLGFTHYHDYNKLILDFLDSVRSQESIVANVPPKENNAVFLPASKSTLQTLGKYVQNGEQGHCAILSAPAAQTAYLLNSLCNSGKIQAETYHSYFMTSSEEALDAALRLSRHHGRNRNPQGEGALIVVDPTAYWSRYFDPLNLGTIDALVPGVHVVATIEKAEELFKAMPEGDMAAMAIVTSADIVPQRLESLILDIRALGGLSILIELNETRRDTGDWDIQKLQFHPDIVVFGECISGFQAPVGACLVNTKVKNPWLMTPNESYVRHVMTNFGLPLALAYEYLSDDMSSVLSSVEKDKLRGMVGNPDEIYDTHQKYGNTGYAKVARMHGFDAHFYQARGVRSQVRVSGQPIREIIDCFVNVGTCPRGLNPSDVIDNIALAHNSSHDYWNELQTLLSNITGLDDVLPASSNVTAVESALTLGLLAAPKGKKLLCFTGSLGFTLTTAASSLDKVFDIFRQPFQPIYHNTVFIDPSSHDAAEKLEAELLSGEIGMVWFETIQVDANASRPVPKHLIELISRNRSKAGYLIGLDETQTNLVTGKFLYSQTLIDKPDIVALGTALCDSLMPMGVVLSTKAVTNRAQQINVLRLSDLRGRQICQLTSHIALNSLQDIEANDLLSKSYETGIYFKQALLKLQREQPLIQEVRGEGLLLTVELDLSSFDPFIERSFGYLLWGSMLRDSQFGVAVAVCPIYNNCIRFLPPLTIFREDIDLIVANLQRNLSIGVEGVLLNCADHNQNNGDQRTANFLIGLAKQEKEKGKKMIVSEISSISPQTVMSPANDEASSIVFIRPLKRKRDKPSICVIGAGVGGLATIRALKEQGIPFDCFDKRDRIGGIWAFDEKGEHTSVWHSMNMNTPKGLYQFTGFPMPDSYPDFPSHRQVHAYLESFVEHFDLGDNIYLNCGVSNTKQQEDGTWCITLSSGEVRYYDALVIANGHHNTPSFPAYANRDKFSGDSIHSKQYRYRHKYQEKKVLVVGVGNSGAQIAVDVSHDAKMTYLSLRRGVYILPHYMFGIRIDKVMGPLNDWWVKKILPYPLTGLMFTGLYKLLINKRKQMKMPKPDHLMMSSLPTLSENFNNRIGDGKLQIVPEVRKIEGSMVHLSNGSSIEVDSIIYSTGYQTNFPFLDPEVLKIEDNKIPLFQRVFIPDKDNIAFVGLFQAVTWGFLDMMERQANMVAEHFSGAYRRPTAEVERASIKQEQEVIKREFLATSRNNYEMHGPTYMHKLKLEMKKGRKRAAAGGNPLPVIPQATANPPSDVTSEKEQGASDENMYSEVQEKVSCL